GAQACDPRAGAVRPRPPSHHRGGAGGAPGGAVVARAPGGGGGGRPPPPLPRGPRGGANPGGKARPPPPPRPANPPPPGAPRRAKPGSRWRQPQSSLPGLTRQSIIFAKKFAKKMDPRVKPAGDAFGILSETTIGAKRSVRAVCNRSFPNEPLAL